MMFCNKIGMHYKNLVELLSGDSDEYGFWKPWRKVHVRLGFLQCEICGKKYVLYLNTIIILHLSLRDTSLA